MLQNGKEHFYRLNSSQTFPLNSRCRTNHCFLLIIVRKKIHRKSFITNPSPPLKFLLTSRERGFGGGSLAHLPSCLPVSLWNFSLRFLSGTKWTDCDLPARDQPSWTSKGARTVLLWVPAAADPMHSLRSDSVMENLSR